MLTQNRVMLVDDEEAVRTGWHRYLAGRGLTVMTAGDGAEAIDTLRTRPADVVVADLKMPRVDGIGLLEWLRSHDPDTRFILLTGYGNEEVERRVRDLGAYGYLDKPVDPEILSAVVTAALHATRSAAQEDAGEPAPLAPDGAPSGDAAPEEADVRAGVDGAAPARVESDAARAEVRVGTPRRLATVAAGLVAAPLLGLAFVIFLPVMGFAALAWGLTRRFAGVVRTG